MCDNSMARKIETPAPAPAPNRPKRPMASKTTGALRVGRVRKARGSGKSCDVTRFALLATAKLELKQATVERGKDQGKSKSGKVKKRGTGGSLSTMENDDDDD